MLTCVYVCKRIFVVHPVDTVLRQNVAKMFLNCFNEKRTYVKRKADLCE